MSIQRLHVEKRYSEVVIHNGTVYLAGQLADDFGGDIREQTRQTLANIDKMLAEAGSDKSKILSLTIFLKDMADYGGLNAEYDAWVAEGNAPARACVEAQMYKPEVLVEMCVVAAV
ncbi:RidA family protein [Pseudomonas sp. NCHU5208]|uniref:RidA family protein n=1 Tax=unclassified Pseudomonas TaxID=196821 RepID=UPI00227AE757|nr:MULTISPECIES: RidA family protein [unclassified Pseudomonas]WAJ37883.1 RidA family protein [Pseudomonas sp. GOM7]